MPTRATDTRSVSYQRRNFNPRRPEKSQVRARCIARDAISANPAYSAGAVRIYVLMDSWAGWGGLAYPKHDTLSRQTGKSRQTVQRWVAELERGGEIIRIERAGRAIRYALRWAAEAHRRASQLDTNPVCSQPECAPRTEPEPRAGTPDPEPSGSSEKSPERECPRCGGTGEREYRAGGGLDWRGNPVPARRWRGPCGCRDAIGDYAR